MQCVRYKFSSKLDHSMVTFHGDYITLHELKRKIMAKERIKPKKDDLQITNADSHEEYADDEDQIETCSFVIVRRIPIGGVKPAGRKFFGDGTAVVGPDNGAMLTRTGENTIPSINTQASVRLKKEPPPFLPREQSSCEEDSVEIPDELLCPICDHVMQYAALTPCCGDSYCDDCIRTALLESVEHTCLACGEKNVSPDSLLANKALRQVIDNMSMGDGWVHKRKKVKHAAQQHQQLANVSQPPPASRPPPRAHLGPSLSQPPPAPTVYLPPRAHLGPALSLPPPAPTVYLPPLAQLGPSLSQPPPAPPVYIPPRAHLGPSLSQPPPGYLPPRAHLGPSLSQPPPVYLPPRAHLGPPLSQPPPVYPPPRAHLGPSLSQPHPVYLTPRAHLGPSLSQPPPPLMKTPYRQWHRQDKSSSNQEDFTKDFNKELMKCENPRKRQRPS